MPDFTFTSPEGKSYTVSGPDGATKEQAFGILQQQLAATPPAAPAAPAAAPSPGIGSQLLTKFSDTVAAPIARGFGSALDTIHRGYQSMMGETPTPYEDPSSLGPRFAEPFEGLPNSTPDLDRALHGAVTSNYLGNIARVAAPIARTVKNSINSAIDNAEPLGDALIRGGEQNPGVLGEIAQYTGRGVKAAGNVGEAIRQDVVPPVRDMLGGVAAAEGLRAGGRLAFDAADTGINAFNNPSAAQASTLAKLPGIQGARQAGYKVSGNDMRRAAPFADPAEIHGPVESSPSTLGQIQRDNQANLTKSVTTETGLANTASVDPAQVQAAKDEAGAVYQKVGQAVGNGRTPTVAFDNELSNAGQRAADVKFQPTIDAQVAAYRDKFAKNGFNGPDALESVKALRADANTRTLSDDPNSVVLGKTNRALADAIENELMRQLPVQAQDLKTAFPAARTRLAKLMELESVTQGGQPSAAGYLKLRNNGAPLSGAAADAANAADHLPESTSPSIAPPNTQVPVGHYAAPRYLVKTAGKIVRALVPGVDESTEAYQTAHYGPTGKPPAPAAPVEPAPPYEMQPPPGQVSRAPPIQAELPLPARTARDEAPPPFALERPEGVAPGPVQRDMHLPAGPDRTLGDELALGSNTRRPAPPIGPYTPPPPSMRGGPPSGYSQFGMEPTQLPDSLALGSNRVSPAPPTTMRGGPPSGYSQLGMEPAPEAPKLSDVVAPKTPNSRAAFDAAAASAVQSTKLRDAMAQIDPRTLQGAPVGLDTLRANSGLSKEAFDKAIADGIAKGEFAAQSHAWPARLTDADKAKLVPNGRGGFYDSIALTPPKS